MSTGSPTDWSDLTNRAREIVSTAIDVFGRDKFKEKEISRELTTDTTTKTLNKLANQHGYLSITQHGGGLTLKYVNPNKPAGDNAEFAHAANPGEMEDLAKKAVRRHGMSQNPSSIDWNDLEEVRYFCERASDEAVPKGVMPKGEDILELVGVPNKYRVTGKGQAIGQKHI